MRNSLSLQFGFPVRLTREHAGGIVPWEVRGFFEDFESANRIGGFFDLSHWGVIELSGKDAKDYVQRMSTIDVKVWQPAEVQHGAFLTGKAGTVSLGMFLLDGENVRMIVPANQIEVTVEHIEKFHFAENFELKNLSESFALFGLWNPVPLLATEMQITDQKPMQLWNGKWGEISFSAWKDDLRKQLIWCLVPRAMARDFSSQSEVYSTGLLGQHLFEYFRVLAGVPQSGIELFESDMILESGFDRAVARNKGCYPGQEVVERIFTYGNVNKKLFRVEYSTFQPIEFPTACFLQEKSVGQIVNSVPTPENPNRYVGFAMLRNEALEAGVVHTDDRIAVRLLP